MVTIGIDLGTSNSAIAYFDGKEPKIIPNVFGEISIPSKVLWKKDGSFYVGREAVTSSHRYECENFTLGSIKRSMDKIGGFVLSGKRQYPQIISALILADLKRQAEVFLKTKVDEAVICIPCNFGVIQRYATIEAAEMAGFKVLRILNESTAAAIAFSCLSQCCEESELIFDLGGGTLDLSLIEYWKEGAIKVEATQGEEFLGGTDFDERIIQWIVEETKKSQGFDPIEDQQSEWHHIAKLRIQETAELAKIELSSQSKTRIYIPYIRNILGRQQHIDLELTDYMFESLCQDLIDRAVYQIELICGCGKEMEKEVEHEVKKYIPDYDKIKFRDKLKFWKEAPQKIVIEKYKEKVIVKGGLPNKIVFTGGATKMKCLKKKIMSKYKNINFISREKELVAMGAAIQAGIIKGSCKDKLILDCTSKSIGIGLKNDMYQKIIPKHSAIPTRKTDTFTTTADNQRHIQVSVYEGERPMTSDNRKIIDLEFGPLLPAKAGVPQVEVAFEIDPSNILKVEAKDLGNGDKMQVVNMASPYTKLDTNLKNKIKELIERWMTKRKDC